MCRWLDIATGICAFVAAIFWFLSAYGTLPPIVSYWGHTPEDDPFLVAIKYSAAMNTWAATFSGFSGVCMTLRHFLSPS